jgi:diguanylate cyclase (GGDEF)-like protein
MDRAILKRFRTMPPARAVMSVVALFVVVATIDKVTGRELSFSLFYLLPVALVSFRWRARSGQLAAVIAALGWLSIDLWSGSSYSHPLIPFWNAAIRFGFFSLVALLLDRLHGAVEQQTALARTDSLTGLPNRRSFDELARRELARAERLMTPLALAIIDLDDFKLINDRQGHAVGDLVLRQFAATTGRALRSIDVAARLGGDEFALLLPNVDAGAARLALQRFQKALLDYPLPIGCSVGVAQVVGGDLEDVLRHADDALYRAKASGKGSIELIEVPASQPTSTDPRRSRPATVPS